MSMANSSLEYNFSQVMIMYERIRNLREDKDLSQREMAEYLQCSQRIYSNYERGDVDIPTGILIKLADFHDTSVDYILNRTDKKESYTKSKTK
jgi:transcriptional regulator with XRE-family HTH domain